MSMSNMKLGTKLALGFAIVLVLMMIVTIIGITRLGVLNKDLNTIVKVDNKKVFLANELENQVANIAIAVRNIIVTDDKALKEAEKAKLAKARSTLEEDVRELSGMVVTAAGKQGIAEINKTRASLKQVNEKTLTLNAEGKNAEAIKVLVGEGGPVTVKFLQQVDELITLQEKLTKDAADRADSNYTTSSIWMIGMGGMALFFGGLIAFLLTRSITLPINRVVVGLTEGAGQVASAAGQVSASSQLLAEGSSEQASSLEETSSSLEEMASMTKQNAGNASQAKAMMAETQRIVKKVDQQMNEMAGAIAEITRTSEETGKIIKTIDEIAFQTNLLALNAAVEAARAGEAGAGFAVVADEVRNLALRAAEAAKNTNALIDNTIKAVKQGSELTQATREAFQENVSNAGKVAQLIDEIAAASQDQAQGIDQINKAVAEMDKVTQQTAANAEESASASEELTAQAKQMQVYVGDLKDVIGGSAVRERQGRNAGVPVGSFPVGKKPAPLARKRLRPEQVIPLKDGEFNDF
jgi:methyl-accepting chemotaxis protein